MKENTMTTLSETTIKKLQERTAIMIGVLILGTLDGKPIGTSRILVLTTEIMTTRETEKVEGRTTGTKMKNTMTMTESAIRTTEMKRRADISNMTENKTNTELNIAMTIQEKINKSITLQSEWMATKSMFRRLEEKESITRVDTNFIRNFSSGKS